MRRIIGVMAGLIMLASASCMHKGSDEAGCRIGAFMADRTTRQDIQDFQKWYGKKPAIVMTFIDWDHFVDQRIIDDVYGEGSVLFVTWEPWHAYEKKAIDYDALLSGKYDAYIAAFAGKLKAIGQDVLLRFGHEMNGNWYPWSGEKIGAEKYIAISRYVYDIFERSGVDNVSWVFSINWENIPADNQYAAYYPGDGYVDYIGIDGYNWGSTQSWSRWMSFQKIFMPIYQELVKRYNKPLIISEFGSAEQGGDKARWIIEALEDLRAMPQVKAFVLFNVDKEARWRFSADEASGRALKAQIQDNYFIEE